MRAGNIKKGRRRGEKNHFSPLASFFSRTGVRGINGGKQVKGDHPFLDEEVTSVTQTKKREEGGKWSENPPSRSEGGKGGKGSTDATQN